MGSHHSDVGVRSFGKYRTRGSYHWEKASRHVFKRDCFALARYDAALQLAGDVRGKRILDYGCGDGAFLFRLAKAGAQAVGFDPDPCGLMLARGEFARRRADVPLLCRESQVPRRAFDVVFLLEVIEHVRDTQALLSSVAGVLKDDGCLVLSTPMRLTETPVDPEHEREFFPGELLAELAVMFEVDEVQKQVPLAAAEMFHWRPAFLLRLPVLRWAMNAVSILTNQNLIYGIGTPSRYYTQLLVRCRKRPDGSQTAGCHPRPNLDASADAA